MLKRCIAIIVFSAFFYCVSIAQKNISLYEKDIPGGIKATAEERYDTASRIAFKVETPTITAFIPEKTKATGAAVLICPGGGYGVLVIGKEGYDIAAYFSSQGVAAFVLKYRLPDDRIMKDKSSGPLQDAQQALSIIRARANEWNHSFGDQGIGYPKRSVFGYTKMRFNNSKVNIFKRMRINIATYHFTCVNSPAHRNYSFGMRIFLMNNIFNLFIIIYKMCGATNSTQHISKSSWCISCVIQLKLQLRQLPLLRLAAFNCL